MEYTTEYQATTYVVGSIWPTNNCGNITILGKDLASSTGNNRFVVKFLETGTTVSAGQRAIRTGAIKDRNKISVGKAGYLGIGEHTKGSHPREYSLWKDMHRRAGNFDRKHPSYLEVTVDAIWCNFQDFVDTLPTVAGYDLWLTTGKGPRISLDKDILGDEKSYSPAYCSFVQSSENTRESSVRVKSRAFQATRLADNYTENGLNQRAFARKYGLNPGGIGKVLSKRGKTPKGWTFKWVEENA